MDQTRNFVLPGQNQLLAALPSEIQWRLIPAMQRVTLRALQPLCRANVPLDAVWFPLGGVASIMLTLESGESVEVATIGNEGLVGYPAVLALPASRLSAMVQVPGQALRMPLAAFQRALDEFPQFKRCTRAAAHHFVIHMARIAACNRVHSVRQRLSRTLLMTQDRVGAQEFELTHDVLAPSVGVRRPSVTIAAGELQARGCIGYRRGRVRVTSRTGLEAQSCGCYETMRRPSE